MLALNLSALGFLFTPLLGVILPLIIWISSKNSIKKADDVGRKVINAQITFTGFIYLLEGFLFIIPMLPTGIRFWIEEFFNALNIPPYLFIPIIYGIPYAYNLGNILWNTFRLRVREEIFYFPSIKLLNESK